MSIEIAYSSDRTPEGCYVYKQWQLGLKSQEILMK